MLLTISMVYILYIIVRVPKIMIGRAPCARRLVERASQNRECRRHEPMKKTSTSIIIFFIIQSRVLKEDTDAPLVAMDNNHAVTYQLFAASPCYPRLLLLARLHAYANSQRGYISPCNHSRKTRDGLVMDSSSASTKGGSVKGRSYLIVNSTHQRALEIHK